jgi:hypothetical protein
VVWRGRRSFLVPNTVTWKRRKETNPYTNYCSLNRKKIIFLTKHFVIVLSFMEGTTKLLNWILIFIPLGN